MLMHEKNATDFLTGISKTMGKLKNRAIELDKNPSVEKIEELQRDVLKVSKDIFVSRNEIITKLPNIPHFKIFHDRKAFIHHVLDSRLSRVSANIYFLHPNFSEGRNTHRELQGAISRLRSAQTLSSAFAKIYSRTAERKPVDLNAVLAEARDSFPSADEKISLSVKGNLFSIGDRELLFKVFHDLISNAVKATSKDPETRKISIVAERHPFQKEMLIVSVKDNGTGFHPEKMRAPCEGGSAFGMQGVPKGGGTALPLVKKITEEHGGEGAILSKEGKGTTFAVSLPRIYKK